MDGLWIYAHIVDMVALLICERWLVVASHEWDHEWCPRAEPRVWWKVLTLATKDRRRMHAWNSGLC